MKQFPGAKRFVVLDAGMTELMRPALYSAFHRIEPLMRRDGDDGRRRHRRADLREHRRFARDRELPPVEVGDLVVVRDVGAYGAVMGHTYLRRPLPPEVLVDGERVARHSPPPDARRTARTRTNDVQLATGQASGI